MVTKVKLEKHVSCTSMFCVIISKFCHRYEFCLVTLFVINEGSKVSFHHTILLLSLAVGLRVESGRKPPFVTQEIAQCRPELGREY